ncbi:hypothetical protein CKO23_07915 [Thiocystis violacea]|nr:hypothetical protein [Thiocystis violacea]
MGALGIIAALAVLLGGTQSAVTASHETQRTASSTPTSTSQPIHPTSDRLPGKAAELLHAHD